MLMRLLRLSTSPSNLLSCRLSLTTQPSELHAQYHHSNLILPSHGSSSSNSSSSSRYTYMLTQYSLLRASTLGPCPYYIKPVIGLVSVKLDMPLRTG